MNRYLLNPELRHLFKIADIQGKRVSEIAPYAFEPWDLDGENACWLLYYKEKNRREELAMKRASARR
jgi:hypothetical protein